MIVSETSMPCLSSQGALKPGLCARFLIGTQELSRDPVNIVRSAANYSRGATTAPGSLTLRVCDLCFRRDSFCAYLGWLMFALSIAYISVFACAVCGLVALSSPTRFARLASFWGQWIDTQPTIPIADSRVDVDSFVLKHSRIFGVLVVAASLFWGAFLVLQ